MQARDLQTVQSQGTSHMPFSLENGSNTVSLDGSYRALLRVEVKQMKQPVTHRLSEFARDKNLALLRGQCSRHTHMQAMQSVSHAQSFPRVRYVPGFIRGIFLRI